MLHRGSKVTTCIHTEEESRDKAQIENHRHESVMYLQVHVYCLSYNTLSYTCTITFISQWLNNDRVRGECDIANIYKGGHTSQHQVTTCTCIYDYSTGIYMGGGCKGYN